MVSWFMNSNNYGLWYANNELVTGANLKQLVTGGPHIVGNDPDQNDDDSWSFSDNLTSDMWNPSGENQTLLETTPINTPIKWPLGSGVFIFRHTHTLLFPNITTILFYTVFICVYFKHNSIDILLQ